MQESTPKDGNPHRTPVWVYLPWLLPGLDFLAFIMAVVSLRFHLYNGHSDGMGTLGCFALTGIAFLPLLAGAWVATLLWKRSIEKADRRDRDLKVKAKLLRHQRD